MILETTTDCKEAAHNVLAAAEKVTTKEEHSRFWDDMIDVKRAVTKALESGAFIGDAYDELKEAQRLLHKADKTAGRQAAETYGKRL